LHGSRITGFELVECRAKILHADNFT